MVTISYIVIIFTRCFSKLYIDIFNPHNKPRKHIIFIIIPTSEMRKLTHTETCPELHSKHRSQDLRPKEFGSRIIVLTLGQMASHIQ